MASPTIYLLPGWQGSGPGHWQTLWAQRYGDRLVEQDDWEWPRRGDWMSRLDDVLLSDPSLPARPAWLVAHSLGCHLVAAWAAHSRHVRRVAGALLVAPPDLLRIDLPPQLHTWRPAVLRQLPFPAIVVLSQDDPYGSGESGRALARAWGARTVDAGARGHLNADSGLGDWPAARGWLHELMPQ
ncbi:MAG: alpha/beta fold hydrolase [Rubrivivax sp.]|nr:alpha/beta fold hydrolase [Rubrivivax sp.]